MTARRIATETDVRALSFYSLCQIAEQTGYADPIGAVLAGRAFDVELDALGNVLAASPLAPTWPCGRRECVAHATGRDCREG